MLVRSNGFTTLKAGAGQDLELGHDGAASEFVISSASNVTISNNLDTDSLDVTNDATIGGGLTPGHMTDAAASNDTIYYSTTQSKLVYKDSGGTVNNLY